ncbi:MAG: enoyl-CoA hydratase/isomerase family protein [Proteobacteria bacterium]|nr:enoyl-CoA hydratase/isomerase family protein [Pseudomonadota bacterium]HQR04255.1 enoyl-CoA hydratase-related protein [Rhodocyclaceae bacterium]
MSESEDVLLETRGPVLWITINRPGKRNAINEGVIHTIREAIAAAPKDASLRAIVLTGAGDKAFCAGADLGPDVKGGAFDMDPARPRHYVVDLFKQIGECTLPIIGRINGHALAGGFGLLAACDMAIAADDIRLGVPETGIGVAPMMILGHMMRLLPRRKLLEMCITAELIGPDEALELGVLNYVVPRDQLDDKLQWLLDRITSRSPTAIRLFKQGFHAMQDMDLRECMEYAQVMINVMARTEDAKEGRRAFQEKRAPLWNGR